MMGCEIFSMWQNLGKTIKVTLMHMVHMDCFIPKFNPTSNESLFRKDL